MTDPQAAEKKRLYAANLAALLAVYTAARTDILNMVSLGSIRGALRPRWIDLLRERWAERAKLTAAEIGTQTADSLGGPGYDAARAEAYLDGFADRAAKDWESLVQEMLDDIDLAAADLLAEVEEATKNLLTGYAEEGARNLTDTAANFAALEAARDAGRTTKTWHTGENARASHLALNGRTVPLDETFSNGLRYPRAPGPPQETVNCNCYLTFGG